MPKSKPVTLHAADFTSSTFTRCGLRTNGRLVISKWSFRAAAGDEIVKTSHRIKGKGWYVAINSVDTRPVRRCLTCMRAVSGETESR